MGEDAALHGDLGLHEPHPHRFHAVVSQGLLCDGGSYALQEVVAGAFDHVPDVPVDLGIVDRIAQVVGAARLGEVGEYVEVDHEALAQLLFGRVDAVEAVEGHSSQLDFVLWQRFSQSYLKTIGSRHSFHKLLVNCSRSPGMGSRLRRPLRNASPSTRAGWVEGEVLVSSSWLPCSAGSGLGTVPARRNPAFAGITMALRRPHKGMKMGPAQCFNVDWDPRRWDWIPAFAGMTMWGGWVLFS